DGRTLVQLSDLHVGPEVDDDYLTGALDLASGLGPDLVVLTGDFMTCRLTEQIDKVGRILGHLKPARLATLAVLGNHDYGTGAAHPRVAAKLVARLSDL